MFIIRFISSNVNPFWIQFFYFIIFDIFGSILLILLRPTDPVFQFGYLDMFFMSTSALTNSGLSTIAMEGFSSSQLVVITLLMLVGGEVFASMLGVFCRTSKPSVPETSIKDSSQSCLMYLGLVILAYWVLFHVAGFMACLLYISLISSSKELIRGKGINLSLFAFSTTVSSFANCGLVATNENMIIFANNSGFLIFQVVLILAGNTLFPLFLRVLIWVLRFFIRNEEIECMLKSPRVIKFDYLSTNLGTFFQSITVLGMIAFMVMLFSGMDWRNPVFDGLNSYQKAVTALFMAVNVRHAGENSVDCSLISSAVLLLFIFMMYLPSMATFMPLKVHEEKRYAAQKENSKRTATIVKILLLPQIVSVIIFVIVACIIERRRLVSDPLNFSTLNVTFEVVSAYGNVGLSTGYACSRLRKLHVEKSCVDQPYNFVGWWSDEGKLLIVFVMLYGRLKAFTEKHGEGWTTLRA